jgi:hypothetical protein
VDKNNQAQWWVAFSLDPSARPPPPQGVLSAGWADVSPIFAPTAEGGGALCVFKSDYEATAYMQSLSAQQGSSHPIITEGLNSRQDLERIAERFGVRYVAVNPSTAGKRRRSSRSANSWIGCPRVGQRLLIHRSSWKAHSANFAQTAFHEGGASGPTQPLELATDQQVQAPNDGKGAYHR